MLRTGIALSGDSDDRRQARARATAGAAGATDALIRLLDLVIAGVVLVALSVIMLAIAVAVRVDSPGPVIFRQRRMGKGGRVFTVYKFRTMRTDMADTAHREYAREVVGTHGHRPNEQGLYKLVDARITRMGRVLRRSSLDELPQLFNVIRGDMSLVGPRPVVLYEVELFPEWYHERFEVPPGLTGLWQVSGRSRLTYEEMVQHDIEFVARRSLRLYLAILARTVPALLFRNETL